MLEDLGWWAEAGPDRCLPRVPPRQVQRDEPETLMPRLVGVIALLKHGQAAPMLRAGRANCEPVAPGRSTADTICTSIGNTSTERRAMKTRMFGTAAGLIGFVGGMLFIASCGGGEFARAADRPIQLFCVGLPGPSGRTAIGINHWAMGNEPGTCRLSTDGSTKAMTYPQVMADGWTAAILAVNGDATYMVFNK